MTKLDKLRRRAALTRAATSPRVLSNLSQRLADRQPIKPVPTPPPEPPLRSAAEKLKQKRRRILATEQPFQYAEIRRIVGLPLVGTFETEEVEEFNRQNILAQAYESDWRLWAIQCEAISAYARYGGLFAPIGVGWGKTIITQAITNLAYQSGIKRIVLAIPSQVLVQLTRRDYPFARKRIPINYPVHVLGGLSALQRGRLARSGCKGLYIIPYSLWSRPDIEETLESIRPGLIICDEADRFGNRRAARVKRLMRYIDKHRPQGVCLSGTITHKSIKDYHHLIKWCLGDNCPLPHSASLAGEWSQKIDAVATGGLCTGPLSPLIGWAWENCPDEMRDADLGGGEYTVAGFRAAYKQRLRTAPGVVATGDAEIGPSLILHNEKADIPEGSDDWERLEDLRKGVTERWTTPNGDEIEHAIHCFKWLFELSAGFYNELTWPGVSLLADREKISEDSSTSLLTVARTHHQAGQDYARCLRSWIEDFGRPGCDTPMLVGLEISKNGPKFVGDELALLWDDRKRCEGLLRAEVRASGVLVGSDRELDKRVGRSFRDSRIVRVCDYKIRQAVKWALDQEAEGGGLIWVWHKGIGAWVHEALKEAGVDVVYCPAGGASNELILSDKTQGKIVVASIKAHGVGKNLQTWNQQFFLQWPRGAKDAEQSLGRTHRNGQLADEVWGWTCHTTEFDRLCFAACLNDSLYIHQSTGNRQKLIYCVYSPGMPLIVSPAVLKERGFQNRQLDPQQVKLLNDRFRVS